MSRERWTLLAAVLGSAMGFIDGTATNVVLPILVRDLHGNAQSGTWVVESYALFLAALILAGGALGDIYGRKAIFGAGVVLFALASLACGFAPTMNALVVARSVQGVGAALATPGSLALIGAAFSGSARGKAIGTWSAAASLTAAGGPVLGGWLAQSVSWRAVFFINVPLAIVVVAILILRVDESRDENRPRALDLPGSAAATLGLGSLTYGLIALQGAVDAAAIACVAAGIAALALFVAIERRSSHPMLALDIFASRTFTIGNLYTLVLYAALGGSLYFVPFDLIDVQRYSPAAAGAALLPFVAIMVVSSRFSGGLVARIGARRPLFAGAVLAAGAFATYATVGIGRSYWTSFFPAALLLGLSAACFVAPLTTTVLDAVSSEHSGAASGINNAVSRVAGLVAVAALGIVAYGAFTAALPGALAAARVPERARLTATTHASGLFVGTVPREIARGDRSAVADAARRAFANGFSDAMFVAAGACLFAAAIALDPSLRRSSQPSNGKNLRKRES